MNWLVSTSLHLRVVVVALAILLMVVGIRVVPSTPLDVFPEFAPPLVEIQTEAPGLSTTEVESLVTVPIENALNGTARLKTMRSKSVLGLSSVVLIFQEDAQLMVSRQLVQERLAIVAGHLPSVAKPPVILSPLSSTSRVMKIGLSSKKLSQMELTTLARWTIRPRLMAIPGVANVAIWGERDRQLQVLIDPDRLRDHNGARRRGAGHTRFGSAGGGWFPRYAQPAPGDNPSLSDQHPAGSGTHPRCLPQRRSTGIGPGCRGG
jgi:Cu/Ag efflux pump CusA